MDIEFWENIVSKWISILTPEDYERNLKMAASIRERFILKEEAYKPLNQVLDDIYAGDDDIGWID